MIANKQIPPEACILVMSLRSVLILDADKATAAGQYTNANVLQDVTNSGNSSGYTLVNRSNAGHEQESPSQEGDNVNAVEDSTGPGTMDEGPTAGLYRSGGENAMSSSTTGTSILGFGRENSGPTLLERRRAKQENRDLSQR